MNKLKKILLSLFLAIVFLWIIYYRYRIIALGSNFDGDCAVFGLMAKRIFQGHELPIYLWKAHYAGTLASFLGALIFNLTSISMTYYSISGLIFSLVWSTLVWRVGCACLDRTETFYVVLLTFFAPVLVVNYSMFSGGIHAETICWGTLVILLLINLPEQENFDKHLIYIGFVLGIGQWLTPGMIVWFVVTVLFVWFYSKDKTNVKSIVLFIVAFLVGFSPALLYNIQNPSATAFRMGGRILDISRADLVDSNVLDLFIKKIIWRLSFVPVAFKQFFVLLYNLLGAVPFWTFFISLFGLIIRNYKAKKTVIDTIIFAYFVLFCLFYCFVVAENHVRYVAPIYIIFPFTIVRYFQHYRTKHFMLALVFLVIAFAQVKYLRYAEKKLDRNKQYSCLVNDIKKKGLSTGYSNYETSYMLNFMSNEMLTLSPTLFYGDTYDRYDEYTKKVNLSKDTFIIHNSMFREDLVKIENGLNQDGIAYTKNSTNRHTIYYAFSKKVDIEKLNKLISKERK